MEKIYSKIETGKLLHIINRLSDIEKRTDVVPGDNFIQCATLKMENGKTFDDMLNEISSNLIESSVSEDEMRQFTRAELNKKAK